ncbi:endo-1,4-beta-xylanase 5-like [Vitis riparia]|uniref:endo-1,4-beta-xylanase 5-like n=1 Tax=Vitis riparia TaxID=96939 RepID=UPI00155A52ED|nr:endo-1,4-beta-xylanase 5-like [Vitis riparia]
MHELIIMKVEEKHSLLRFLLLCSVLLYAGFAVEGLSYDYTASVECLEKPLRPQYGGGMILNPDLNDGLKGWSVSGGAKIEERVSGGGNRFIVAHSRSHKNDSVSQKLYMKKDKLYTFSAWIQVSSRSASVAAAFRTNGGVKYAGAIIAETGCWSMLKGGLTVEGSGPAQLYFESNDTSVEIWVDSVSLQPFTKEEWRTHQDQSVEKTRKTKVRLQAVDGRGNPVAGAKMAVTLAKRSFPFGAVISDYILQNTAFQNWFTSRFSVATFANEMKWYSTENSPGVENYKVADDMLQFCKQNGIAVRGHNILWDDPKYQPSWVKSLSPGDLQAAVDRRINSIASRYKGQVIAWDVVNENLHFSFFEDKLGASASAAAFQKTRQIDGTVELFMNDYNTIEERGDGASSPAKYLQKLGEIQAFLGSGSGPLAIGLEGHFGSAPNLPYVRSSIDTLAAKNLPIWVTEVDVSNMTDQAMHFQQILEEVHAHPAVKGIVTWGTWDPRGCYRMCLTDGNFKNLPTGDVLDKILGQWSIAGMVGVTDANGVFEASLFHGDYEVTISHPTVMKSSLTQSLKVVPSADTSHQTTVLLVEVSP